MVLESLFAGALAYANTAYTYNQGRYQFDKGQEQLSGHQLQNLRVTQWNLFREDIRDLITLTTSHMSTYMVVGTLFLGFSVSFVWSGVKDFPADPPWLMLLWGNCFFSALCYGVLGVWLAMHGSIAAQSASVQMLTQAIRPPIPSAEEVRAVAHNLSNYEASGLTNFLMLPDVFGTREKPPQGQKGFWESVDSRGDNVASQSSQQPSRATSSMVTTSSASTPASQQEPHAAMVADKAGAILSDDIASPLGTGPGCSAAFGSHVQLFQHLQATYVPFDAYARVSLSASANQLLLAFSYFFMAHVLTPKKQDKMLKISLQGMMFSWGGVGILVFMCITLYNLDLFVDRIQMRWVKFSAASGPIISAAAVQLWEVNKEERLIPWLLVLLASFLHLTWMGTFLWEARPQDSELRLPMSFRSVRYLNIFGHRKPGAPLEEESADQEIFEVMPTISEAPVESQISLGLVGDDNRSAISTRSRSFNAQTCSYEARVRAQDLQTTVQSLLRSSQDLRLQEEEHSQLRQLNQNLHSRPWMQCEYVSDTGQPVQYWVNIRTREVSWDRPKDNLIVNLADGEALVNMISESAEAHRQENGGLEMQVLPSSDSNQPEDSTQQHQRRQEQVREESQQQQTQTQTQPQQQQQSQQQQEQRQQAVPFLSQGSPSMQIGSVDSDSVSGTQASSKRGAVLSGSPEAMLLESVPRRPGSTHGQASMPWKYFAQVTAGLMFLWAGLIVYCFIAEGAILFNKTEHPKVRRLASEWPHDMFMPSAVACAGELLVVGDRFEVHGVRLPRESDSLTIPERMEMELLLSAEDIGAPWVSFDLVCGRASRGRCDALMLLEEDGRTMVEVPLAGQPGSVVKKWPLARSLPGNIVAFVTVDGEIASRHCKRGNSTTSWAIFAATDAGESVALCPRASELHPSRRVAASWPHPTHHAVGGDLIGLHVDKLGHFWRLTHAVSAEFASVSSLGGYLHASAASGKYNGRWSLPRGRTWARGICGLGGKEKGFIMAATHSGLGQPELWHINTGLSSGESRTSDKLESPGGELEDLLYSAVV